ncbi:hypothetical protein N7462_005452 [Penicillium macrosclerotiorum]|uniref:uncharacterized protein n=1 Tax=Penicillium macrosclerotiorum TaxID=303699 RepID=UPI00254728BC|nr:uncharacterized protein N7462_005452 [Penicillium macrosclerotiorum]KAJ5682287.1 hypothetical protein N7462_005452 [Penicillium macrosclerotiorum]
MDLLSVLPDFSTKSYTHILPPLERSKITTVDLVTLDTLEIAKRAHVPPADVRRLAAKSLTQTSVGDELSSSFHPDATNLHLGPATKLQPSRWSSISTLDPALDSLLGGGIPIGYVTEVTGESGSGKTQFLFSLLLSAQLASPDGLGKNAIYISTEHPLSTNRVSQLLESHPRLSSLPPDQVPSLKNILSINAMDLETQDHILNYQLPVAITRHNIGLVVIDSITSNYRAEHSSNNMLALSARSTELAKLGQMLRNLAAKEDIAIVLANQVSDRFEPVEGFGDPALRPGFPSVLSQGAVAREVGAASPLPRCRLDNAGLAEPLSQYSPMLSSSQGISSSPHPAPDDEKFDGSYIIENPARNSILSLLHQERFFTGWGDGSPLETSLKTPALGFFWSTQIACRIALKKEEQRSSLPLWDAGSYPTSTPSRQPDSQDVGGKNQLSQHTATISSAREAHAKGEPGSIILNGSDGEKRNESTTDVSGTNSIFQPPPTPKTLEHATRRIMKLVFAPWTAGLPEPEDGMSQVGQGGSGRKGNEVEFEIWTGGLRSIDRDELSSK